MAAKQATIDSLQSQLDDVKEKLAGVEDTVETGDMMAASAEAKALYTVLGKAASACGHCQLMGTDVVVPMVSVDIENGMLKATAEDYTSSDAPDEIEGWLGALIEHKDGHFGVVYSDRGTDGGKPLYDLYMFHPASGRETEVVWRF